VRLAIAFGDRGDRPMQPIASRRSFNYPHPTRGTTKAHLVSFLKCRPRLLTVCRRAAFLAVDFSFLVKSLVRIVAVDDRMNRDTTSRSERPLQAMLQRASV